MAQALNETRLRHWMQTLGPRLIHLSAGICRDRHQAEEIVQEAFLKLWRRPPEAGEVAFSSWLRKVVTNLSINALQRTKRPRTLPEFSDDPALRGSDSSATRREAQEELDQVRRAMDRLDDSKRAILILRAQEQLTYEQIAEHLEVPLGTVMSRLNRARVALLEELKRDMKLAEDVPMVFEFQKYAQG